jgi:hypothetical protein
MYNCVEMHLRHLVQRAIDILPGNRESTNTIITTSSGNSVTIIPLELDYVLQVFTGVSTYNRIKDFWTRVTSDSESDMNLAEIKEFYDDQIMIKVEKVLPLNNFTVTIDLNHHNLDGLVDDVTETLVALGRINVIHGDPRLDNIGWSNVRQTYVLYDYDSVKCNASITDICEDQRILEKSINYHTL